MRFVTKKVLLITTVVSLVTIGMGTAGYEFAYKQGRIPGVGSAKNELVSLTEAVEKTVILPENEIPTLATVSDKEKLQNQTFFARAENGDKVLIYTQSNRAILYRPSANKVVEMAPVAINTNEGTVASAAVVNQPANVAIFNGTQTVGLAKQAEMRIQQKSPTLKVVAKENAQSRYPKSVVIDVSGKQPEHTQALAQLFNAEITQLPAGETPPATAEILIILGDNFIQ